MPTSRLLDGSVVAYGYNNWVANAPLLALRSAYLRAWLRAMGEGTTVQMGCRFMNARKVFQGEPSGGCADAPVFRARPRQQETSTC